MTNFHQQLEDIISSLSSEESHPKLFIHSCCAPCSSYVLEYLSKFFLITVYYFNPNIFPATEHAFRCAEQERLIQAFNEKSQAKVSCEKLSYPILFKESAYQPELFENLARGLEAEAEGGARCKRCFALRLEEAAKQAKEGGFDYFTTTLTISPMKDVDVLNQIGQVMGEKYGVKWLPSNFKKKGGYARSVELSKEYGLYRQDFCGCRFSRRDAVLKENV